MRPALAPEPPVNWALPWPITKVSPVALPGVANPSLPAPLAVIGAPTTMLAAAFAPALLLASDSVPAPVSVIAALTLTLL